MLVKLNHPRFGAVYVESRRILFFHSDGGTAGDTLVTLVGGTNLHVQETADAIAGHLRRDRVNTSARTPARPA